LDGILGIHIGTVNIISTFPGKPFETFSKGETSQAFKKVLKLLALYSQKKG